MKIPEANLPVELRTEHAIDVAYGEELGRCAEALKHGLSVLVECDKELTQGFYLALRKQVPSSTLAYLDGTTPGKGTAGDGRTVDESFVHNLLGALRTAVSGAVTDAAGQRRVLVLPHLDLLTASTGGGLSAEAREVIPLLYRNPQLLWLGFKDPSFAVPAVIQNLFQHHESILGIRRDTLPHLVTQREARKFGPGPEVDLHQLYSRVSGMNAVRLRRVLEAIDTVDYPENPERAYVQLRRATLRGGLTVPKVNLDRDIGGYGRVKERLRREILDLLEFRDQALGEDVARIERLIPRGIIFWGPPGTGKTLFAKAMATHLGAAITIVSGPELKSQWVGESEANLRRIFVEARRSAPALIVFDELDSFASQRGTYRGSGVEHSMVNQLLTEMDGFRKEELVFVIGTTNLVQSLDPALLRPGRFEFPIEVPYPEAADRDAILRVHGVSLGLAMRDDAIRTAVELTETAPSSPEGARYSGDHLQALCRQIARDRLRARRSDATTPQDVEAAFTAYPDPRQPGGT